MYPVVPKSFRPCTAGKGFSRTGSRGIFPGIGFPAMISQMVQWVNYRLGATWSSMTSARYGVVTMVMRIGGDTFSPSHVYSRGNNRPMKSISGMRSFINLPLKRRCCPEVQRSVSPAIAPAIGSFCCLYRSRNRHRDNRDRSGNICHEPPVIYPPARVSNPEYGMFQKLQHLGTLFLFLKSIL